MTVNLSAVPLVALSVESKQIISVLLNPPKVIPSENGLPRDWRGLAHLSNLSGEILPLLTSHPDPSAYILTTWEQKQKDITIKDFQIALEEIERWDIIDDTLDLFEKDAEKYLKQLEKSQTSAEVIANEVEEEILTVDDLYRKRQGLENQYYDAFLLYADKDSSFANEMVDKLENQYNLKLCLKDRDLIGGVTFEHEAVMTLISERCNRLIVIVSSNFLKSPANKFFLNYAQALGIEKRQRKVIPCLYEKCQLPPQLNYMFVLDYNRVGLYDFWGKLRASVQTPKKINNNTNNVISEKGALLFEEGNNQSIIEVNHKSKTEENTKYLEPLEVQILKNDKEVPNTIKNLNQTEVDILHNTKDNNKKSIWNQLTKLIGKGENDKKVSIRKTVSLTSLASLETLSTSIDSMEKQIEKKLKSKSRNKLWKKMQLQQM